MNINIHFICFNKYPTYELRMKDLIDERPLPGLGRSLSGCENRAIKASKMIHAGLNGVRIQDLCVLVQFTCMIFHVLFHLFFSHWYNELTKWLPRTGLDSSVGAQNQLFLFSRLSLLNLLSKSIVYGCDGLSFMKCLFLLSNI